MPSTLLDEHQAAQILGLSVRTLQARRFLSKQPPFVKIGRSVRYRQDDLEQFVTAHRVDPQAA